MALLLLRSNNASGRGNGLLTISGVFRIVSPILDRNNNHHFRRSRVVNLHTNADRVKRDDPYAILGLQWGDGATIAQIKTAYLARAAQCHPDVVASTTTNKAAAVLQFQKLKQAYEILTKAHSTTLGSAAAGDVDEWRVSLWRNGDRIAVNRTDVAGVSRVRPIPPASVDEIPSYSLMSGGGTRKAHADFIGPSTSKQPSTVGTGRNKWVEPVAYKPWKRDSDDDLCS
jgi:hypothetical protein